MNRFVYSFGLLLCLSVPAGAETPEQFQQILEAHRTGTSTLPKPNADGRKVSYILVTGMGGEAVPRYYAEVAQELKRLIRQEPQRDPSEKRVFIVRPSSRKDPTENFKNLAEQISVILLQSSPDTRFTFVGHSKGALELWGFLSSHPELVGPRLEKAIFVQGPFQGTPLATAINENMSVHDFPVFSNKIQKLGAWAMKTLIRKAGVRVEQMTPEGADRVTSEVLNTHGNFYEREILPNAIFLTSDWPGNQRPTVNVDRLMLGLCRRALSHLSPGPSDGLIRSHSQVLRGASQTRRAFVPGVEHTFLSSGFPLVRAFARTVYQVSQGGF